MKFSGLEPTEAIDKVLGEMTNRIPEADGGAIVISKDGKVGFGWNSVQMAWAYGQGKTVHYGVDRGEDETVPIEG